MNDYDSMLLVATTVIRIEGRAPDITSMNSVRFDELHFIYLVYWRWYSTTH